MSGAYAEAGGPPQVRGQDKKQDKKQDENWNARLCHQLALDYCCSDAEAGGSENQFHIWRPLEGRRQFESAEPCFLKVLSFKGKLLFTGQEEILAWCRERFAREEGAWFMEPAVMRELDRKLEQYGYGIGHLHPFYVSFAERETSTDGYEIRYYRNEEIEAFRGDARFSRAYSFCPTAPDVIGAAAFADGELLGMAGASADGADLWQIGIDVLPQARGRGIGVMLVSLLRNEILRCGKIPYYGTAVSHTISQNIAIRSGFLSAWTELTAARLQRT